MSAEVHPERPYDPTAFERERQRKRREQAREDWEYYDPVAIELGDQSLQEAIPCKIWELPGFDAQSVADSINEQILEDKKRMDSLR